MPIHQAIEVANEEDLERLAQSTVKKHLTALTTLLNQALKEGVITENVASGITVAKRVLARSEKRKSFTSEQLERLFTALRDNNVQDYHDDMMIALIAMTTGARVEEICQLLVTDIQEHPTAGWFLSIDDSGEESEKRLKNPVSHRVVPCHPLLIECGLLDMRAESSARGDKRIFSKLTRDSHGRLGGSYGKRFTRIMRGKAGITDRRLVFHSFRHGWKTLARQYELPDAVQNAIVGHTGPNAVADGYGERTGLDVLAKWMCKLDFGFDAVAIFKGTK
jgi:integrase